MAVVIHGGKVVDAHNVGIAEFLGKEVRQIAIEYGTPCQDLPYPDFVGTPRQDDSPVTR